MTRVFGWQTDGGACHLYRTFWPFRALDPARFECSFGAPGVDIVDYDVVVGQRIAGPSDDWLDLCRNPKIMTVMDLDDDLVHVDPSNTVPYSIYHPIRDDTIRNIQAADMVTVASPRLAELVSQWNSNVVILPNCLPREYLDLPLHEPNHHTLGWGGSPFHGQDWEPSGILPSLMLFRDKYPHYFFHTFGENYTSGIFSSHLRTYGWGPLEHYLPALNFDFGVAPLADTPFNNSKSHCKALEYGCRGIPVIASAVGQYNEWVQDGVNGFLVHQHTDWLSLMEAMTDPDILAAMSEQARITATQYCTEDNIHLWEKAYEA